MFYNTYRTTKNSMNNAKSQSLSKTGASIVNPKERWMNLQKREKLKGLLITKFMKKYGITNPEKILEDEITKFLQGEKLNDADLQRLDAKINRWLIEKKNKANLKATLTQSIEQGNGQQEAAAVNNMNQAESIYPNQEGCASQQVHEKAPTPKKEITTKTQPKSYGRYVYKNPEEELAELEAEEAKARPHVEKMDFSSNGDEWNAIAQYNKKLFEQDKINEKIKDNEVKRRTKEDLDNQVKQKLKRAYEQNWKDKEYDTILIKHLKDLEEIERQKAEALKRQVLREKENRDVQMKDEYTRKRIDILKEKKFDRELIKHLQEEIENEKKAAIDKKQRENAALKQTLKDNELNKKKQMEALAKEREDDIRSCEEYAKTELKRENERKQYFKNIERNSNNFMTGTAKKALDDMERQNKEDDEKRRQFEIAKDKMEQEEEDRIKYETAMNKKNMKAYLDMQVMEKNKMKEFEKILDSEQARIWNTDCKKYFADEKIINEKIRKMNRNNLDCVMEQIKNRKENKHGDNKKMSQVEMAMNRDILEKAKVAEGA